MENKKVLPLSKSVYVLKPYTPSLLRGGHVLPVPLQGAQGLLVLLQEEHWRLLVVTTMAMIMIMSRFVIIMIITRVLFRITMKM